MSTAEGEKRQYALFLDKEDDGKLRDLAKHHKVPMSEIIRRAIRQMHESFDGWIPDQPKESGEDV